MQGYGAVDDRDRNVSYLDGIRFVNRDIAKGGREVSLSMDIILDSAKIKTQHTVALTPVLVSEDGKEEFPFGTVIVDGRTRHRVFSRNEALGKENIHAELVCQVVDSTGNVLREEEREKMKPSSRTIMTQPVFINEAHTEAVRAVIVNPYWIAFRQMGAMLVATVLLILFVAACIVYQVRIIIKQNKIARIRQDFTYAMIHDMKTPISTISMAGHTLESGLLDSKPELRKRYFTILNEESAHLLSLSEKILTIAKLEQSRLRLVRNEVDLPKLFDELVKKFEVKTEKKATFEIDCPSLPPFLADEEYLKEAISNLIDNSLKYSGDTVRIRLSAKVEDGFIRISVRDNGWGIPLKRRKRIFEKFDRGGLEYKKDKKVSGFGLGLNYVYRVITAMGGKVELDSVEGAYSEFILSLPIEEEKA